jgi:RND superfamily putative drug exporter
MRTNLAARAGRWSAHHRRKAILGWLAFVLLAFVVGGAVGQRDLSQVDMGNGDSQRAGRAIEAADFPDYAEEQILVQDRGTLGPDEPATRAAVADVYRLLSGVPYVFDVKSPLSGGNSDQISPDGHSALVTFKVAGTDKVAQKRVAAALAATEAAQRANPAMRIEEFGEASVNQALEESFSRDFHKAEVTSLPITLAILLVAFGSLVAAGVPLLLGITAVIGALGLLGPISHVIPLSDMIGPVVLLIGLAVGVDYSLFYLRRKLEERDRGASEEAALQTAAATSGRAVLVSGLTVIVAMAGMFLAGNAVFTSFAVGTIVVVAVAIVGSLTVLPAVLAALGPRVEWGRVPIISRRRHSGDSRVWGWILDRVLRRPVVSLALGAGFLIALSVPAISMHTLNPGASGLPRTLPIMRTYDRMMAAFPGGPMPAMVVVHARDVTAPPVAAGIRSMLARARAAGLTGAVFTTTSPDRTVSVVTIPLPGDGTDTTSEASLGRLRDHVIPATIGRVAGTDTHVGGTTAESRDFNDVMKARLPIVFTFVLGLAFLLLLLTFRSIVVPTTAIALNLLSVGAAYGVVKLIFQDGNLESVLGFTSLGGVVSWLPIFLFVVLFGLSMDYNVFILSRIREGVQRGLPSQEAVAHAIKATAGVVTSAAVVMVAVFSIFATLSALAFKQFGVALAVAIFIDATIVRGVLLPSAMTLLGPGNWYLPRWLEWLPYMDKAMTEKGAPAGSLSTPVLPTGVSNGGTATRPPSSSERDAELSASSTAK